MFNARAGNDVSRFEQGGGADRERGASLPFIFGIKRWVKKKERKKKGVTGFKRVRIQKSLDIRVKKSVLYCANTITSQGRGERKTMRKDGNVTLWRSELKCSFCEVKVEIRAGHMFLFLCLPESVTRRRGALCLFSHEYGQYSVLTPPPSPTVKSPAPLSKTPGRTIF